MVLGFCGVGTAAGSGPVVAGPGRSRWCKGLFPELFGCSCLVVAGLAHVDPAEFNAAGVVGEAVDDGVGGDSIR